MESAMNRLIRILANSRLLKGELDYHLVLMKDVVLLAVSIYLLKEDVVRASLNEAARSERQEAAEPRARATAQVAAKLRFI
jgi:hypothetical protein